MVNSLNDLTLMGRKIDDELAFLLMNGTPLFEILGTISKRHEFLTSSVIKLSEEEMAQEGMGQVPAPYCWINMGSAARHEQTLRTDQDNAMIYGEPYVLDTEPATLDLYFANLARKIVDKLDHCGFALCRGGVMAVNSRWRKSLEQWLLTIEKWSGSFNPEDTRDLTIFLDFRPVGGDHYLADQLWKAVVHNCRQSDVMTHMLADDELKNSNPITVLGRIRTGRRGPGRDQINIKTAGLVHIVNAMRIYALKHDISEASTLGRIQELNRKKVISGEDSKFLKSAFETLTMFRIKTNISKIREDRLPDDSLYPARLDEAQRKHLKEALSSIPRLRKMLARDFTLPWLNFFS
ncbi:MAG: hypothetical protein HQK66_10260 [Desulfamplus sp.]|nr:hypothetical protein [Desulfamplus sp.]